MAGYSHVSMEVKLSTYRKAVRNGCQALHNVAQMAHKPGLSHLYGAVQTYELRCKRIERTANSQLRAMVRLLNRISDL